MRMGIQAKLITTLVLAGLLPLILSLAVVSFATVRIRTNSVGQSFRAVAHQGASQLSTILSAQVEFIWLLSHLPGTVEFLNSANQAPPLTREQIAAIEKRWPELSETDALVQSVLNNPLAERWHAVHDYQRRFAEVLVTDASGRLVAATNKTTDYFQADEPWWQHCYANGDGRIVLTDIDWDESAVSMTGQVGVLVATLCMPIRGEVETGDEGRILGVIKVSLDARWLLEHLARLSASGDTAAQMWLVQGNGQMVPDGGASMEPVPAALMEQIQMFSVGWTSDSGMDGKELLGFANVHIPQENVIAENVAWYVLVASSRRATLGPVYRLTGTILMAGAGVIVICFAAGFLIARREIIRPLMELRRGAGELERGNIGFRLALPQDGRKNERFRDDEIGRLARDFNRMADELERLVGQLKQASAMKQQFIDLASHELRTPITYILGVSDLAQRQLNGGAKPVLEKINAKAQRLSHIVDNMFKLIGSGSFDSELHRQPVDLKALIDGALRELDPFLNERGQRWEITVPDDLPLIQADAEKLHDVLVNLLSNAIRFSPDAQAVILRVRQVDESVEIAVADRGGGIPQAELPRIFEPFFTGNGGDLMHHTSGEYAHLTRGIGLGLSVVKRFVELHNGTISVTSSPNGTEFLVNLPLRA